MYVGFTAHTLVKRLRKHICNAVAGGNTHLHKALRKYGSSEFTIDLLEIGDFTTEKYWISKLKPQYNMTVGGEGGDTSSSPNFRRAMREYHSKKPRTEYATFGNSGKTAGTSTKTLQSKKRKLWWGENSANKRENLSRKLAGKNNGMSGTIPSNAKPVLVDGILYPSIHSACKLLKLTPHFLKKKTTI